LILGKSKRIKNIKNVNLTDGLTLNQNIVWIVEKDLSNMIKKRFILREKNLEKKRLLDINKRVMSRNIEAMSFCINNGFTVYVMSQYGTNNRVKVFKQKGENFLPVSDKLYDHYDDNDVREYIAVIDAEYDRVYNEMKDKL
jgi:hypothetical protein